MNDRCVTELEKRAGASDGSPAGLLGHRPYVSARGPALKQRIFGALVTVGVQLLFLTGILYGTNHSLVQLVPTPLMIDLITEVETKPDIPAPPPPKLVELRPQTVPITESFEITPEVVPNAPPAQNAITTAPPPEVAEPGKAVETFQIKLLRHLARHKRYPTSARTKKEQGVVYVRFTMDRAGRVLSATLERPSPHGSLNQESLGLIRRAEPLPAPPPEVEGAQIEMVVPVEFFLR